MKSSIESAEDAEKFKEGFDYCAVQITKDFWDNLKQYEGDLNDVPLEEDKRAEEVYPVTAGLFTILRDNRAIISNCMVHWLICEKQRLAMAIENGGLK